MPVDGIPKHLVKKLTRAKFEQLADKYIQATLEPCKIAIKDSGIKTSEIVSEIIRESILQNNSVILAKYTKIENDT